MTPLQRWLAAREARGHRTNLISRFGDVTLTANDLRSAVTRPTPGPHIPIPAPDYTMRVNFSHAPLPDRNTKRQPKG